MNLVFYHPIVILNIVFTSLNIVFVNIDILLVRALRFLM